MVIVCTVKVVCMDEQVKFFYIGHQENLGKTAFLHVVKF